MTDQHLGYVTVRVATCRCGHRKLDHEHFTGPCEIYLASPLTTVQGAWSRCPCWVYHDVDKGRSKQ